MMPKLIVFNRRVRKQWLDNEPG